MKLDRLRERVTRAVPRSLLLGVPMLLQRIDASAADVGRTALSQRGFETERSVSTDELADAFTAELDALDATHAVKDDANVVAGPGPFTRLVKALRASMKSGVLHTGRQHAGMHLKSIFSMERRAFMDLATEWAEKGMHSVLLVSDDAAETLALKGVDKLDELNRSLAGKALSDVPFNQAMSLPGGTTVKRTSFYNAGEKLTVTVPARELGVTREMVGIFDAKAYRAAIDEARRLGRDPKLIDPNTFCEPPRNVDELTFVFFGQLDTGQKLVNGLLTMFPRAERVAIGGLLVAGAGSSARAENAQLSGTSAAERVQQITAEHIAAFAAQSGLSPTEDITSAWDALTDAGVEIGAQIAIDWSLITAFGSRVGGVISLILMPTTLNGGEGAYLQAQREHMHRAMLRADLESIVSAMVADISEQVGSEMLEEGYPSSACRFADQIRPHVESVVRSNLETLLGPQ